MLKAAFKFCLQSGMVNRLRPVLPEFLQMRCNLKRASLRLRRLAANRRL
jgi:hypothetical protein